jgi:UDP-glucuronate 4-epimerase
MAIHKFASALCKGEPIPVFGDGGSSRDYTYVDDILVGVLGAVDLPQGFAVFNLGGDRETRLLDLIQMLGNALGVQPNLVHQPEAAGDVPRTSADLTRATVGLGYRPKVSIEDGLARFAAWYRTRQA